MHSLCSSWLVISERSGISLGIFFLMGEPESSSTPHMKLDSIIIHSGQTQRACAI